VFPNVDHALMSGRVSEPSKSMMRWSPSTAIATWTYSLCRLMQT
jgi:hypothetical protein